MSVTAQFDLQALVETIKTGASSIKRDGLRQAFAVDGPFWIAGRYFCHRPALPETGRFSRQVEDFAQLVAGSDDVKELLQDWAHQLVLGASYSLCAALAQVRHREPGAFLQRAAASYQQVYQALGDPQVGDRIARLMAEALTQDSLPEADKATWLLLDSTKRLGKIRVRILHGRDICLTPDPSRMGLINLDRTFLEACRDAWQFVSRYWSPHHGVAWWVEGVQERILIRGRSAGLSCAMAFRAANEPGFELDSRIAMSATLEPATGSLGEIDAEETKCQLCHAAYCVQILLAGKSYDRAKAFLVGTALDPVRVNSFEDAWHCVRLMSASRDYHYRELPRPLHKFAGRQMELETLNQALEGSQRVIVLHGFGGRGKTALVREWLDRLKVTNWKGVRKVFAYSFYNQGTRAEQGQKSKVSDAAFFRAALLHFGDPDPTVGEDEDRMRRLVELVRGTPSILVLDGLEVMQDPVDGYGVARISTWNNRLANFLQDLAERPWRGLCVVTTRHPADLPLHPLEVEPMQKKDAEDLITSLGVHPDQNAVGDLVDEYGGLPLALVLVAKYLVEFLGGDPCLRGHIPPYHETGADQEIQHVDRILNAWKEQFEARADMAVEHAILRMMAFFIRPVPEPITGETPNLLLFLRDAGIPGVSVSAAGLRGRPERWQNAMKRLVRFSLLREVTVGGATAWDVHPHIREYFRRDVKADQEGWKDGNRRLCQEFARWEKARSRDDPIKQAELLEQAIYHACEAEQPWDAFTLLAVRADQQLSPKLEFLFRWAFRTWARLARIRLTRPIVALLNWLGEHGCPPLAQFYDEKRQLDQPVKFHLAYKLRQWDLRLTIARNFYPRGFTGETVFNDGFVSGLIDMATSRVLAYLGFSRDARAAGWRADRDLTRMGVHGLVFLIACGRALLEIYTGNLNEAISLAEKALEVAKHRLGYDQAICDALCILARAHAMKGRRHEADQIFAESLSYSIPSTRAVYFYWLHVLRTRPLREAEEVLRQAIQQRERFTDDEHDSRNDWETVYGHTCKYLFLRQAREKVISASEALRQIEHVYDVISVLNQGCYHRASMAYLDGRAAAWMVLTGEDRSRMMQERAERLLEEAYRRAEFGDYELLRADILTSSAELLHGLGKTKDAKQKSEAALRIAEERHYAWGREDATKLLAAIEQRSRQ